MTTLNNLGLGDGYSISKDEDGVEWVWAPTADPDPACEALCDAGKLMRSGVDGQDGESYMTYRVVRTVPSC